MCSEWSGYRLSISASLILILVSSFNSKDEYMFYLQITTVQNCMAPESLPLPYPVHCGGYTVMLFSVPAKHISKAFPVAADCLALIPGWQLGRHFQCVQV